MMRTRNWVIAAIAATHLPIAATAASAATTPQTTEILVRFAPGVSASARAALHRAAGAQPLRRIEEIGYDVVRAPSVSAYRGLVGVETAEENIRGRVASSATPSDACTEATCDGLPGQWHLRRIGFPDAWRAASPATATAAATIAVLDTKVDAAHPDWISADGTSRLDPRGKDLVPSSRWAGSAAYHGTFVAGLAGAAVGNATGTAGLAWSAKVLPVTVIDGGGATDAATLSEGLIYAWSNGARVINLSLGLGGDSSAVHDAVKLVTKGDATRPAALVVAAAGNNGGNAPFFPGSYSEVMSVSGTDASDRAASCSNHNSNVSVSAPADRLVGIAPRPEGARQAPCGTSAATPLVAGLAAQLFAQDPSRSPAQVRALIESNSDDLGPAGRDDAFGHGRINAGRALAAGALNGTFSKTVSARSVATTVTGQGGITTVTARAKGASIKGAQAWVGGADGAPVDMRPADGSFGGTDEQVLAEVRVPNSPGPHNVWVRVWDGVRWSAAATAAAAVDSRAPSIADPQADGAMRATGTPLSVRFTATDDLATKLAIGIEFRSSVTNAIVARVTSLQAVPGAQRFEWRAPIDAPAGRYIVKIAVADQAGNVSQTEIGAIVA